MRHVLSAVILIGLGLFLLKSCAESYTPSAAPAPNADADAFVGKLIAQGIVSRLDSTGSLWVKPAFYALDYKDKQAFVRVAWLSAKSRGYCEILLLKDNTTGKRIGTYSEALGLDMK